MVASGMLVAALRPSGATTNPFPFTGRRNASFPVAISHKCDSSGLAIRQVAIIRRERTMASRVDRLGQGNAKFAGRRFVDA